jgi:hypothetical protein
MSQRACAFCKESGHRITNCTDYRAVELKEAAEFKCGIAIQYLGTGAEDQMYREICAWFDSKTVIELKVMIAAKNWSASGRKPRIVARAIWAYYFNQWIPQHVEIGGPVGHRFICRGRYHGNIANGITEARAREIYTHEMNPPDEQQPEPEPVAAEVPIIDGLTIESVDCPICFETQQDIMQTNCGHLFCRPCIITHTKGLTAACPCCRTEIDLLIMKSAVVVI